MLESFEGFQFKVQFANTEPCSKWQRNFIYHYHIRAESQNHIHLEHNNWGQQTQLHISRAANCFSNAKNELNDLVNEC